MKILAELTDRVVGTGDSVEALGGTYELRKSARGIVLNEDGLMATQFVAKHNFYKLPGGGVMAGETIEAALRREIKEEVGCVIDAIQPIGVVIEYRNQYKLLHVSYGFVARVKGEIGPTALEEKELAEGQETKWLAPTTVLQYLKTLIPIKYEGRFIVKREQALVEAWLTEWSRK